MLAKRLIAVPLWFLAVWCLDELAWSLAGAPRIIGPVLATAVTAFVALDPGGWIWHGRTKAAAAPPGGGEIVGSVPLAETTRSDAAA